MAELRLENVSKHFGEVVAVDNLSLVIPDQCFVALLGPSGCGKSTTLNLIAGLEELTSGSISLDGQPINHLPPNQRDMAMVFQDYALYPHMTAFGNMSFSLRLQKRAKEEIQERVLGAARILNIEELLDRRPKAMSGGQRQRVALGRAIVRNPKVFLMDEPLSNLDERLRVHMRTELKRLHAQLGKTTVYVTHDQEEAMRMSDKIAVLRAGVLQQVGTHREIFYTPANIFVASFVGSPPINLFVGRIEDVDGSSSFRARSSVFKLSSELVHRLLRVLGSPEIIMGLRPDYLKVCSADEARTMARVSLVEPFSSNTYVEFESDGDTFTMQTGAETDVQRGDRIPLSFDESKLHFFDPQTERRLVL